MLVRHGIIEPPAVRLSVVSDVPIAQGVSSSAALEVATARALVAEDRVAPVDLALLCQEAENRVLGVPCGIMDQAASSAGTPGAVLPILCRPVEVGEPVDLPRGVEVVGWPSGATHDVGGAPYRHARTASFMGRRMAEAATGRRVRWTSELGADAVARLPDEVVGAQFLERFGGVDDPLSAVEPSVTYPVRAAASFGVEEHLRTRAALDLLRPASSPISAPCCWPAIGPTPPWAWATPPPTGSPPRPLHDPACTGPASAAVGAGAPWSCSATGEHSTTFRR